jgi:hypothetical protein
VERPGFQHLVAEVCTGQVGAVLCIEASRLARSLALDAHHHENRGLDLWVIAPTRIGQTQQMVAGLFACRLLAAGSDPSPAPDFSITCKHSAEDSNRLAQKRLH